MKSKLQVQLEEAYQLVVEAKGAPCPCTMGKKCTKKGCECKACKKALKESHEGDMSPTASHTRPSTPTEDHEGQLTKAKIVLANITDDLDDLRLTLQKLYGGRSMDLDQRVEDIFDRIDARIETIVPTEDY